MRPLVDGLLDGYNATVGGSRRLHARILTLRCWFRNVASRRSSLNKREASLIAKISAAIVYLPTGGLSHLFHSSELFPPQVLAYGPTGTGKTYTMGTSGTNGSNQQPGGGVIPRTMARLFDNIDSVRGAEALSSPGSSFSRPGDRLGIHPPRRAHVWMKFERPVTCRIKRCQYASRGPIKLAVRRSRTIAKQPLASALPSDRLNRTCRNPKSENDDPNDGCKSLTPLTLPPQTAPRSPAASPSSKSSKRRSTTCSRTSLTRTGPTSPFARL